MWCISIVTTPFLEECEDDTHTPEMGTWKSFGTPKLQNSISGVKTPRIGVFFYIIGKISKCRCRKWACMGHLNICSTSYGKKKGRESKIKNRPNPGVCKGSATHRWKALKESYKFSSYLIPIGGLNKEL
jgi:hypothetical protein